MRHPLIEDRLRLIAAAHADWVDAATKTLTDLNSAGTDTTQTTTRYALGLEAVWGNATIDLAWLAGEVPAGVPGPGAPAASQTLDLSRLVVSATLGW